MPSFGLKLGKWLAAVVVVGLGIGLVFLVLHLRDDFDSRWASVVPGMDQFEAESLLGEPTYRVPQTLLDELNPFDIFAIRESWIYDRPIGLGQTYRRYILRLRNGIVEQKNPP